MAIAFATASNERLDTTYPKVFYPDQSWTWCAWMKTSASAQQFLMGRNASGAAGWTDGGKAIFTQAKLSFDAFNVARMDSSGNPCDGEWHHVAFSFDHTTGDGLLFIDGAQDGSLNRNWDARDDTGQVFKIGSKGSGSGYPGVGFDGDVEDVRCYERVLAPNEIAAIHQQRGADPVVDDLQARWTMSDGAPGVAVSGSVADIVNGNGAPVGNGTPEYSEGFVTRRRSA